jgi:hypothetical protein
MLDFIICMLVTVSITNIVVNGSIFYRLRHFVEEHEVYLIGDLLNCMMCSGFWVGLFVGTIYTLVKVPTLLITIGSGLPCIMLIWGVIIALTGSLVSDLYSLIRGRFEEIDLGD